MLFKGFKSLFQQERKPDMANYTGKCFSCGEVFKDGDDIVVCPECGTPYHRECYLKEGKCINDACMKVVRAGSKLRRV